MQQRRGTEAQWTAANPTLAAGEIGFETDNNRFKIGDGATAWASLDYFANSAALSDLLDGAPDALNTLNELAAAINDDPDFFTNVATSIADSIDQNNDAQAIVIGNAVSAHGDLTTNVHGIADTAALATTAATETAITNALTAHNAETTNVHGISDTSALATTSDTATAISDALTAHNAETTNVHGISDTSVLATEDYVTTAISNSVVDQSAFAGTGIDWNAVNEQFDIDSSVATKEYADDAVGTHNSETTSVHGIADTAELETQTGAQGKADLAQGAAENYADSLIGDVTVDGTAGNTVTDRIASAEDYTDSQIDAHVAVTTNVHGIADTSKIVLSDAVSTTLEGALIITGDLTVNGSEFIASATSITIEDNLLQLAHENAANTVDLGLVVAYNDGAAKHAGIARDVSDAKWKLFKDVSTEPTTTVAFTEGSLDDLAVNNVEVAGVVFTDGTQSKEGVPSRTPIVQKTASYSLSTLTHRDSMIEVSSTSGTTVTIPAESSVNYPVGTTIDILQTNTGQVTIAGAAGVTVNATPGLKLRTRWSSATLMKRAADTWVVYGDLTA